MISSHQSKKRSSVGDDLLSHSSMKRATNEDDVSEDANPQLHQEIIDTIIGVRQTRQNSGTGIMSTVAVGIKKFWAVASKDNSILKVYKN